MNPDMSTPHTCPKCYAVLPTDAPEGLCPACLMSGDTSPELIHLSRQAGLTLLFKPVRPAKLRSLLRKLVAGGPNSAELGEIGGGELG